MPKRLPLHPFQPPTLYNRLQAPAALRPWLLTQQSLTQKLKQTCQTLQVQVLSECWQTPLPQEARALKLPLGQKTWVRCVLLHCDQRPVLYARTIIPHCLPGNPWYALKKLGNQPLGEVLFQKPLAKRSGFTITQAPASQWPYLMDHLAAHTANQNTYARQSCFYKNNQPLLLTEAFLTPPNVIFLKK